MKPGSVLGRHGGDPAKVRRAVVGGLVALAALGVFVTITARLSEEAGIERQSFGPGTYALFYALMILIQVESYAVWKAFAGHRNVPRTTRQSILDIGLMTLGKYVPGKVWGLLARGAVSDGRVKVGRSAVIASVSEQVLSLSVGILLVVSLYGLDRVGTTTTNAFPIGVAVLAFGSVLVRCALMVGSVRTDPNESPRWSRCAVLLAGYVLLWATSALPFLLLVSTGLELDPREALQLAAAFLGSIAAGFVAFFSPGGIGVREAVFAWSAPTFVTWQEALYWIAAHRSLSLAFDLVYGTLSFAVVVRGVSRPSPA